MPLIRLEIKSDPYRKGNNLAWEKKEKQVVFYRQLSLKENVQYTGISCEVNFIVFYVPKSR